MPLIEQIKIILREKECPFFTDDEIQFYLSEAKNNRNNAIYDMLQVKAQNTTLNISGLTCADTSKYFLRLAQRYRPNNSGILKG